MADNPSKAITTSVGQFLGPANRMLLIPQTIWEWIREPTADHFDFGFRIVKEIIECGAKRAVVPYKPKFVD